MKKDLQKNYRNLGVMNTIQDSALTMWYGMQPELCMCCMGMFLMKPNGWNLSSCLFHMSLSREFILLKKVRFQFQLKLEMFLVTMYYIKYKHLQIYISIVLQSKQASLYSLNIASLCSNCIILICIYVFWAPCAFQ